MRNIARALILSIAGGLVGPLMRFATWPLVGVSWRGEGGQPWRYLSELVYHLTLLLWPAQPLAVSEVSIGTFMATVYAIGANIVLFAVLGATVVAASFFRWTQVPGWLLLCMAVIYWEIMWTGSGSWLIQIPAVFIALAFYGLLVIAVGSMGRFGRIPALPRQQRP